MFFVIIRGLSVTLTLCNSKIHRAKNGIVRISIVAKMFPRSPQVYDIIE